MLRSLRTDPFVEALGTLLVNRPSSRDLSALAKKRPDAWAQMVKTLAGLCGYSEKTVDVHHQGTLGHIHKMSDAQLRELAAQLAQPVQPVMQLEHEGDAKIAVVADDQS